MPDSSSYYAIWVDPHKLESSWSPGYFNPIYEDLEKELKSHPELYRSLSEIVEVVSPTSRNERLIDKCQFQMVNRGGALEIEEIGSKTMHAPIIILPPEAIIISRVFSHKLSATYWLGDIFPGKGAASPNYIILKPVGKYSIGWVFSEIQKDYCGKQIERNAVGATVAYHINIQELLNLKIRVLSQEERNNLNRVAEDQVRNKIAISHACSLVLKGQESVKPFLLTGATFQEKIDQFEEYLLKQDLINPDRLFFVEASTSNHNEDLFIVRRVRLNQGAEKNDFIESLRPQKDIIIDADWRNWYWKSSSNHRYRIFNSIFSAEVIPSYLLTRMIVTELHKDEYPLLKGSLLPTFNWYREVIESYQNQNEIDWDAVKDELAAKWLKLQIDTSNNTYLQDLLSVYGPTISNDLSSLSNSPDFIDIIFRWLHSIFYSVIGLKVIRDGETLGVYLLCFADQLDRPYDSHVLLEGIGQRLSSLLEQPSEMMDEAAKRESLRRLSTVMHRLNGPIGRATGAMGDLNEFLNVHEEISDLLVPDEKTANTRAKMAEESLGQHTIKARLRDLTKAIDDIRLITYQIKRLKSVQGKLPRTKVEIADVVLEAKNKYERQVSNLKIDVINDNYILYVMINRDAIFMAISEVLNNACRELKENLVIAPEILIQTKREKNKVVITVSDNGLPIEGVLISQPFEEDSSSYARSGRGSGLGLAIVKETFRAHGGNCSLKENYDSEGNRLPGVIFRAELPNLKY